MSGDARRAGQRRSFAPRARGPARPSAPTPTASDALMAEVLARLGGAGRAREFRAFDCYARVVGQALRASSEPERLAGTTLYVRVASSALAHEITLLRGEILARMIAELGPGVVDELRTKVGKVEAARTIEAAGAAAPRPRLPPPK